MMDSILRNGTILDALRTLQYKHSHNEVWYIKKMPKKLLQKEQIEKAESESQIHCSSSSPSPIRKTKDEFGHT